MAGGDDGLRDVNYVMMVLVVRYLVVFFVVS